MVAAMSKYVSDIYLGTVRTSAVRKNYCKIIELEKVPWMKLKVGF